MSSTYVLVRRSSSSIPDSPGRGHGLLCAPLRGGRRGQSAPIEHLLRAGDAARGGLRGCRRRSSSTCRALAFMEPHRGRSTGPGDAVPGSLSRITSRSTSAPPTTHSRRRLLSRHPFPLRNERNWSASAGRRRRGGRSRPPHRALPSGSDFANWGSRSQPVPWARSRSGATSRSSRISPSPFTVSDHGLTYRFTPACDARWSDGEPVTADDFAFTFAQMVEDEVEAAAMARRGLGASAPNARTLRFASPRRGTTSSTCSVSPRTLPGPAMSTRAAGGSGSRTCRA